MAKITVQGTDVSITKLNGEDYICLTDMMKAKDGEFFVTDWLRNRNTMEFIGVWEKVYNPAFNYGEFAIIKMKLGGRNMQKLTVKDTEINITKVNGEDYICITDMLKAKDGDFFVTDWLRNRNTLEYIGTWESVYNPDLDFEAFSEITNRSGLNNFKISVKEWVERTNPGFSLYFFKKFFLR